jgi:WD40 repeat protein
MGPGQRQSGRTAVHRPHGLGVRGAHRAVRRGRPVVISGSIDRTVRVWDLATRAPVVPSFTGHTDVVFTVAIAQLDGRTVVISGSGELCP